MSQKKFKTIPGPRLGYISPEEKLRIGQQMSYKGIRQEDLGPLVGVGQDMISRYLNAKTSLPTSVGNALYRVLELEMPSQFPASCSSFELFHRNPEVANLEDKVGEAKAEIETAKLNLLDAYLTKIKDVYAVVPPQLKDTFLKNLERVVLALEQSPNLRINPKFMPHLYDPITAKDLRERAGLSAVELGRTILGSNSAYRSVYRYEAGEVIPKPNCKVGEKYLAWLKEQGYNPYKL